MTEPEQWAVELWTEARRRHDVAKRSPGFYNQDAEMIAALTIQRAFEERERELRDLALSCVTIEANRWPENDDVQQALKTLSRRIVAVKDKP